ncbi:MAG: alpha/beta hydrolase [Planctomycetaceae bacterium]
MQTDDAKGVVVLVHGIRGSRRAMVRRAELLRANGYCSVLIDLQGHGESSGDQITVGHLERHDVRAAVEYARREHPGQPIGVIGVSLGGASALLASPLGIDAIVLESVYSDIDRAINNRVAASLGPLAWLPAQLLLIQLKPRLGVSPSELRPIDHLAGVGCPVFLISGSDDYHTTAAETAEMFERAQEPKELWMVAGAAHVDLLAASPEVYSKRVIRFLDKHMSRTPLNGQSAE